MSFFIHVIGNSTVFIPISVLKTSAVIGLDLKLGPQFLEYQWPSELMGKGQPAR